MNPTQGAHVNGARPPFTTRGVGAHHLW